MNVLLSVSLDLLVAVLAPRALHLPYMPASASAREIIARVRSLEAIELAPSLAVQSRNADLSAEGKAAGADDDPQQIASFQDLIREEKFQEVERLVRAYVAAHQRSWKAYYILGYVQFRQRKIGDSVRALAKSLELNTDNADAHRILGRDLCIIGQYDFALREYAQVLRLDPASAETHYNIGRVYAIQDDFHKARQELEAAIRLDADYMEAYNALGFAMEALGDDAAALEDYQAAVHRNEERHGKFEAPYVNLAGYYNYRGKLDLALEYANKALALNPNADLAYFQIAKVCRARQDWKGVAEALEKAIAINSSRAQYYYVLAAAYRKLGKIEESQRAIARFQDLGKQDAEFERQRREADRGLELRPVE